jgi:hypothetical protein
MICPRCGGDIPEVWADECWWSRCIDDPPLHMCEYGELVWEECVAESNVGVEKWSGRHICDCGWEEPFCSEK